MEYETQLINLVQADERVMDLLRAVRSLGLHQWCIAAGTIRNLVWDHLHDVPEPTLPSDIDVLIFDAVRTDASYERLLQSELHVINRNVTWDVVNQATIHHYTGDTEPYTSIENAMSRWADLVTAVGAHLGDDDKITIVAPGGDLDDLFELRVRPNIATPNSTEVYRDRMASKGWLDRWPMLTIEPVADD